MSTLLKITLIINLGLLLHFLYDFHMGTLQLVGIVDPTFWYSLYLFGISTILQFLFLFDIIKSFLIRFFVKIITFLLNLTGLGGGLFLLYSIRLNEVLYKDIVFESSVFSLRRIYFRDEYLKAIKFFYEKHNGIDLYNKLVPIDYDILCQSKSMKELELKVEYHIAHPKIPFLSKVFNSIWKWVEPIISYVSTHPEKVKEMTYEFFLIYGSWTGLFIVMVYIAPKAIQFLQWRRDVHRFALFAEIDAQPDVDNVPNNFPVIQPQDVGINLREEEDLPPLEIEEDLPPLEIEEDAINMDYLGQLQAEQGMVADPEQDNLRARIEHWSNFNPFEAFAALNNNTFNLNNFTNNNNNNVD